jgi:DNA-binding beta-propeller fold protein YncE
MEGRGSARGLVACLSLSVLMAALAGGVARADEQVSFAAKIDLPEGSAPLLAFDISFVDPRLGIYILADRSNAGVDVFSVVGQQFLFRVGGFAGPQGGHNDIAGPNGIVTVHHREIWAADGNNATDNTESSVKVVDLLTQQITDTIVIPNGKKRADEMAWDRRDDILLVANDAEDTPFITFISTKSDHQVLAQISFPEATNGIEQSQWSPVTGLFYLNLPEVAPNGPATGEGQVVVIDPKRLQIVHRFTTHNCDGAGLALGPDNQALIGCQGVTSANVVLPNESQIIDLRNGHVIATFPQVGGADQVWFDRGDNHYYLAAFNNVGTGPVLGAIDAETLSFDNNVATAARAHSVAADPFFNNVFVPLTAGASNTICPTGCIGIYRHGPVDGDDRDADRGRDRRG